MGRTALTTQRVPRRADMRKSLQDYGCISVGEALVASRLPVTKTGGHKGLPYNAAVQS